MDVLLTGSNGFIGSCIDRALANIGLSVLKSSRIPNSKRDSFFVSEISGDTDWRSALPAIRTVIHTAARAHVAKDETSHPLAEYRKVNVAGTLNLAKQAAEAGVRRFVFISSIGVNGNVSSVPFTENDEPNPAEPYAQSKWEAEQGLRKIQRETGMELVIIRPPLVYGPNAPGNFGRLVHWVDKSLPLPLGAIHNKRSLVALDNLTDLIIKCIDHPAAANQVFLAGDGEDVSTTELLQSIGRAMGKPARLMPVPAGLLMFGASLLGKRAVAQRLLGSLQVDISKARDLLGWEPPLSLEEGLQRCFASENEC